MVERRGDPEGFDSRCLLHARIAQVVRAHDL
jgi:hypothetical protein